MSEKIENMTIIQPSAYSQPLPSPESDTIPQTPLPSKSTNKWLVPTLVIALIVSLGTTAFFAYQYFQNSLYTDPGQIQNINTTPAPTPQSVNDLSDSTADWQTYSNNLYEFSFKYPAEWEVRDLLPANKDLPSHQDKLMYLGLAPANVTEDNFVNISLSSKSEAEVIAELKNFPPGSSNTLLSETKTEFNNYPATEILTENPLAKVKGKSIIFAKNNLTFVLSGSISGEDKYLDQIISTFQFTNMANIKKGWKTYTNDNLNFSIEYPEDWLVDFSSTEAGVEGQQDHRLAITQEGYKLEILWPIAYGPSMCIFDDQSRDGVPEFASFCEGEFEEFTSSDNKTTYRRLGLPSKDYGRSEWSLYTRNNDSYFITVPPISYVAPLDYQTSQIEVMDQMMASFRSN